MKICIQALGTTGDVVLFHSLAVALEQRGHRVTFVTVDDECTRRSPLSSVELIDVSGITQREECLRMARSAGSLADRTRTFFDLWLQPVLQRSLPVVSGIAAQSDYFISNLKIALRRGGTIIPGARITYEIPESVESLARFSVSGDSGRIIELVAFERDFIDPNDDWSADFHFIGLWNALPTDSVNTPLDSELTDWLKSYPRPVVLTLGSMESLGPEGLLNECITACAACSRGLIVIGNAFHTTTAVRAESLIQRATVSYSALFPHAGCVLHHGSYGTTSAILASATPSIVLPQLSCQHRLATTLHRHRLSGGFMNADSLTAGQLTEALQLALSDFELQQNLTEYQRRHAPQLGLRNAVDLIERHAARLGFPD